MHEVYRSILPGVSPLIADGSAINTRRLRCWQQLILAGFTLEQLRFVLEYVADGVRKRGWSERHLRLEAICDPGIFEEHLSLSHWMALKSFAKRNCIPPATRYVRGYGEKRVPDQMPEPKMPKHLLNLAASGKELAAAMRSAVDCNPPPDC